MTCISADVALWEFFLKIANSKFQNAFGFSRLMVSKTIVRDVHKLKFMKNT